MPGESVEGSFFTKLAFGGTETEQLETRKHEERFGGNVPL